MRRLITTHHTNPVNEELTIEVVDEPGHGGACHNYLVSKPLADGLGRTYAVRIDFQNGPLKENGTNGVTHEALLAIIIDRLTAFQSGPFACVENASALAMLETAVAVLKQRTERRKAEGVEGTLGLDAGSVGGELDEYSPGVQS